MNEKSLGFILKDLTPGRTLIMVNESGAYLSIVARIIKSISVEGVELWTSPA
jgi:hypothetical protein